MIISVVLPVYNERGNIVRLIREVLPIIRKFSSQYEVIVVDDNSSDGTVGAIKKAYGQKTNVKLFVRKKVRGLATAILYGIKKSSGDMIVVMDTDFNHEPIVIRAMIARLQAKSDMVVGSRFISGGGMDDRTRYLFSLLFNRYFLKPVLRSPVTDNLSGFFAIKRNLLLSLPLSRIFYGYGDYFFRLIYFAKKKKFRFSEVPSYYRKRTYGTSKSKFLSMITTYSLGVLKLRLQI